MQGKGKEKALMKSDSEEARRGSNISLKINYNIKTVGKNIGLKPGLKLHHFAFKMLKKSCKGGFPLATPRDANASVPRNL